MSNAAFLKEKIRLKVQITLFFKWKKHKIHWTKYIHCVPIFSVMNNHSLVLTTVCFFKCTFEKHNFYRRIFFTECELLKKAFNNQFAWKIFIPLVHREQSTTRIAIQPKKFSISNLSFYEVASGIQVILTLKSALECERRKVDQLFSFPINGRI